MFELGDGQHDAVEQFMRESGLGNIEIRRDFRQIRRMIAGTKC